MIEQPDFSGAFFAPFNTLARMQMYRNAFAPQEQDNTTTNALATYGGPTRAAANALENGDWTRGRAEGISPRLLEVLTLARDETGIPFFITEGMRDKDRQAELLAAGKSQTMNSRHIGGNAVDIAIPGENGSINWDFDAYAPVGAAAKSIAQRLGYDDLVWGGDWSTLKDGVHFQVR